MSAIGDVSASTHVHVETIRYYERIGLLPKPARTANGRRTYSAKDVDRLAFIRRARDLGFPLDDIRALLSLADRKAVCREAHALATRHRDQIRAKIKALKRLDRVLSETAAHCSRTQAAPCPVIAALAGGAR